MEYEDLDDYCQTQEKREKGQPRYAYGVRNGRLIHLNDKSVGRGLEAMLDCPGCDRAFQRVGHPITPYLKHSPTSRDHEKYPPGNCEATWRSGIHEEIIRLLAEYYREQGWAVFTEKTDLYYDENKNPEFYADLVLESPVAPFVVVLIEVRVTHGLEPEKRTWILNEFDERGSSVWTFDLGGAAATQYLRAVIFNEELNMEHIAVLSGMDAAVVAVATARSERLIVAKAARASTLREREWVKRDAAERMRFRAEREAEAQRNIHENGWRDSQYYEGFYRYFGDATANIKEFNGAYQVYFTGGLRTGRIPASTLAEARHAAYIVGREYECG